MVKRASRVVQDTGIDTFQRTRWSRNKREMIRSTASSDGSNNRKMRGKLVALPVGRFVDFSKCVLPRRRKGGGGGGRYDYV